MVRASLVVSLVLACASFASAEALRIDVSPSSPPDHVSIVLSNTGTAPIRIFREAFSWGYFAVSLELTTPDGKTVTVRKRDRPWDKNYPGFDELGPGKNLLFDEKLTNEEWMLPAISGPVMLRAVYTVVPDAESAKNGVWTGTVRSKPISYSWPMTGLLRVEIDPRSSGTRVNVKLTNLGDKPLRLFRETCSWGYGAITFEADTASGKVVTLTKKARGWRANVPSYDELAPGKTLERLEVLTPDVWTLPVSGKVFLSAHFTIAPDDTAKELGAWVGAVRSPDARQLRLP